ncbi:unnamed protein product [Nyctereutes procyonoides]|uniref:Keratin, type II cytoskeletal 8 n=1 Tax=Nyctereutes procyonoides TaxID=34880 RepID=A0A811YUP3_NYCPR|nr:unnamed protein product [Nyctereutes procyonoides]
MSTRVTSKFYKMSTSDPWAFSSLSYTSGSGSHISSSAFSQVGSSSSSFWGGMNSSMNVVGGYSGPGAWGGIIAVSVNQSLLSPLKLEVDPNIQAVHPQEKLHIKSLNKFASFINKRPSGASCSSRKPLSNIDNMFESYINNLWRQLDLWGQEKLKLEVELGNMQGLMEDFKNKYEGEIRERADMENEFVLIKKDVDEAYMNKIELESCLEGLTNKINFLRQLYLGEMSELQFQILDMSVVLSMDNSPSLDLDGPLPIIAEVKAQYEDITNCSRAEAKTMYRIKHEELQTLAGKHGDDLSHEDRDFQDEPEHQLAALEAAIADTKHRGELAIKDTNTKVAKLEATLQRAKQDMELMNVKLALDIEIATYHKLLEVEESRLESGMQNMSIHMKITSGYSGGLNLAYGGLTSPGLNYGQSSFQSSFGPGGSSSRGSSSKAVVVKKIETCGWEAGV